LAGSADVPILRGPAAGQFDLTWSLLELHLNQLKPQDFLWKPPTYCWMVRSGADGV
jgi:hypothetical protein